MKSLIFISIIITTIKFGVFSLYTGSILRSINFITGSFTPDSFQEYPLENNIFSNFSYPGTRGKFSSWKKNSEEIIIFGGRGFDTDRFEYNNEVWVYNMNLNQWKLVKRDGQTESITDRQNSHEGIYNTYDMKNYPSGRLGMFSIDLNEEEGMGFMGRGYPNGYLNDVWMINYTTTEFKIVKNLHGRIYIGEREVYDNINRIDGRSEVTGCVFGDEIVIFGGYGKSWGYDGNTIFLNFLNGLWMFNSINLSWKLMKGEEGNLKAENSVFIEQNVYNESNCPSSRITSMWKISKDVAMIFGGKGKAINDNLMGILSDIWNYNISTNMWKFVGGNKYASTLPFYGIEEEENVYDDSILVGGRYNVAGHVFSEKEIIIFGGHNDLNYFSDLFIYNFVLDKWKFFGGSKIMNSLSQTSEGLPGARMGHTMIEFDGSFFIWGGKGYGDGTLSEGDPDGYLNDGWVGNYDFTTCDNIYGDDPEVCHSRGKCLKHEECTCEYGWGGNFCDTRKCFDTLMTESSVCGGKGYCFDVDICLCLNQYDGLFGGEECNKKICYGKLEDEIDVCSGRGECKDDHTCSCTDSDGIECEIPMCFGIRADNETVCSGSGVCVGDFGFDIECVCNTYYIGNECETFTFVVENPSITATGVFFGGTIMAIVVILVVVTITLVAFYFYRKYVSDDGKAKKKKGKKAIDFDRVDKKMQEIHSADYIKKSDKIEIEIK